MQVLKINKTRQKKQCNIAILKYIFIVHFKNHSSYMGTLEFLDVILIAYS